MDEGWDVFDVPDIAAGLDEAIGGGPGGGPGIFAIASTFWNLKMEEMRRKNVNLQSFTLKYLPGRKIDQIILFPALNGARVN